MKNTIFCDMTACSPARCLRLRQTGPDGLSAQNTTIRTSECLVSCPGPLHCAQKCRRFGGAQCILLDGFILKTKALMTLHYWLSSPMTLHYWQLSLMKLHYWQSSPMTLQYWQSTPSSHQTQCAAISPCNYTTPPSPPVTTQLRHLPL